MSILFNTDASSWLQHSLACLKTLNSCQQKNPHILRTFFAELPNQPTNFMGARHAFFQVWPPAQGNEKEIGPREEDKHTIPVQRNNLGAELPSKHLNLHLTSKDH